LFRNNDSTSNPAEGPERGDLLLGLVFCGDPWGEDRLRGARGVDVAEEVDALAKWGGIDEAISPELWDFCMATPVVVDKDWRWEMRK